MTATLKFYLAAAAIFLCLAAAVRYEDARQHLDLGARTGLTNVLDAAQRAAKGNTR